MGKKTDIAQCPVQISYKKHGWDKYRTIAYDDKKMTAYGYLDDFSGAIRFAVVFSNNNSSYRFDIAKSHLFQIMLYHLAIKPIHPKNVHDLWLNKRIKRYQVMDTDLLTYDMALEKYKSAVSHLDSIIKFAEGNQLLSAQAQMQKLVDANWKIALWRDMERAENTKLKSVRKMF